MVGKFGASDTKTKVLRKHFPTFAEVSLLFDQVFEEYPESENRLSLSASIVNQLEFESNVCKIQGKGFSKLHRFLSLKFQQRIPLRCMMIKLYH